MMEQISFTFVLDDAKTYLRNAMDLADQRDEINARITEMRNEARQQGVPTKAVDAAVKAARAGRKARLEVTELEFQHLLDIAEEILEAREKQ